MEFSPFSTPFSELCESDLQLLVSNGVNEGWYVEFKSEVPVTNGGYLETNKIVKTISSFANTHGGFYVLGVKTDSHNKASDLCGITLPEKLNLEDQLSKVISSNIKPVPPFSIKTITLTSGKHVIIVRVDEGSSPPYITSQGIIYMRENNECNPVKDRYIFEKFAGKADGYLDQIEDFCRTDYSMSKGQDEKNESFLEVYLFPLPFNMVRFDQFGTDVFFKSVADSFFDGAGFTFSTEDGYKKELNLTFGLNSIMTSPSHLTIRGFDKSSIIDKGTIVELHANGAIKFTFRLSEFKPLSPPVHYEDSEALKFILNQHTSLKKVYAPSGDLYQDEQIFRNESNFTRFICCIDGAEIIMTILFVMSVYRHILSSHCKADTENFGLRAKAVNLWRKFLFFDDSSYLDSLRKFNIPTNVNSDIDIPSFRKGKFYEIDLKTQYDNVTIVRLILEGIGLPGPSSVDYWKVLKRRVDRFADGC